MEENKITLEDSIEVINAKLKTAEYADLDNAQIAHMLQDMGMDIDFGTFMIQNRQITRR
jgi:hypothetical protein